ncbi:MAG: YidC/Oxa1 family membrane protein insertase [Oscillospiraceae bacterium]|nr:YidC/Oxa1 family membrane protein insertase [Oscillospiraceae bacterium]
MTLFEIIGAVLIGPLKLLFELIFSAALSVVKDPGLSIIVLSLAMNVLVLPLYKRADAIQIEARDTENKLKDVVSHIKKTFSGDERMMILQTYYRQNNYNPLSVLSGSVSLLLEIPFFMAAYQFLSGVSAFSGVSFGPIPNLSAPDGLLQIGGLTVNLLPIIMTLVNVISSSLYLKGFPLKTKIQLYGMALFFLVFLYQSPSALVFYWTLNNLFSLVKTLFYRIKNSKKLLSALLCVAGIAAILLGALRTDGMKALLLIAAGIAMQLPWLLPVLKKKLPFLNETKPAAPDTKLFVMGALFLTVLVGLLIPGAYISASPQEYIDSGYFYSPVWYIVHTLCISAGTFLVWLGVFYWLAAPSGKVIFSRLVWSLGVVMLVNYMFFGAELGVVSPDLIYEDGMHFARREHLINLCVVLVLFAAMYVVSVKLQGKLSAVLLVGAIAMAGMSAINLAQVVKVSNETRLQMSESGDQLPSFRMSQDGQNVVVIMLDRGIGPYIPFLMEENPTLKEQFDGFTYYSNTLSFGGYTNFGTPPLYGGYEYTPVNMNLRDTELLADKHNEALKVLPALFTGEGYDVTLIDPSYAGYQWTPDISLFDDMDGVSAYLASGRFNTVEDSIRTIEARKRNFFLFSMMKTLPTRLQNTLYNQGAYWALPDREPDVSKSFMDAYLVMENLTTMTEITEEAQNTYMLLRSDLTHDTAILQEPDFEPSAETDNSAYYPAEGKTITDGETSYLLNEEKMISHYHSNMAALIQLGNWFDYLREQNVYDNTRIIIVSDHGRDLEVFDRDSVRMHDIEFYLPMLLVKDFGASGFVTSDEFMTNADVPTLATEGLIESPVNPFTGNEISSDYKAENDRHYVILSNDWEISENNGYQFLPSEWAYVSGAVREKENWTFLPGETVLPAGLTE